MARSPSYINFKSPNPTTRSGKRHQLLSFVSQQSFKENRCGQEDFASCIHILMHAWKRNHTGTHPYADRLKGMHMYTHKEEWIQTLPFSHTHSHKHTLSNTHTALSKHWLSGRAPLWFWLPVKGKQHELLWPKKCIPDQSHMRLALHLYHVSALALRGLEKFGSALREMLQRTSRAAGVRRWMKNRLIFMAELTSAFFFFFFVQKPTWQIWVSHVSRLRGLLKGLSSPDFTGERWRKMKISSRWSNGPDLSSPACQLLLWKLLEILGGIHHLNNRLVTDSNRSPPDTASEIQ